jgi:hypothetical protein
MRAIQALSLHPVLSIFPPSACAGVRHANLSAKGVDCVDTVAADREDMAMKTLTQAENEAIVRLLLAGRRQDGTVSIEEDDEFKKLVATLSWVAETDLNFFVVTEAARIRKTIATRQDDFIAEQCACLQSPAARSSALAMLSQVLAADGLAPRESAFLATVRKTLNA